MPDLVAAPALEFKSSVRCFNPDLSGKLNVDLSINTFAKSLPAWSISSFAILRARLELIVPIYGLIWFAVLVILLSKANLSYPLAKSSNVYDGASVDAGAVTPVLVVLLPSFISLFTAYTVSGIALMVLDIVFQIAGLCTGVVVGLSTLAVF